MKIEQKETLIFVNTSNFCFQAYLCIRDLDSDEEVYEEIPKIIKDTKHSNVDIKNTAKFLVKRLWAIYKYTPTKTFKGQTVLMRVKNHIPEIASDYGLSKVNIFVGILVFSKFLDNHINQNKFSSSGQRS